MRKPVYPESSPEAVLAAKYGYFLWLETNEQGAPVRWMWHPPDEGIVYTLKQWSAMAGDADDPGKCCEDCGIPRRDLHDRCYPCGRTHEAMQREDVLIVDGYLYVTGPDIDVETRRRAVADEQEAVLRENAARRARSLRLDSDALLREIGPALKRQAESIAARHVPDPARHRITRSGSAPFATNNIRRVAKAPKDAADNATIEVMQ